MSDRIVRPTFTSAPEEVRPATRAENISIALVAFGTAGFMLFGAVKFGEWIYHLIR